MGFLRELYCLLKIWFGHIEAKYAAPGTKLEIEITVEHRRKRALATVKSLPFFNPERKRA